MAELGERVCVIDNGRLFITIFIQTSGTGYTKMGWAGNTEP